MGIEIPGSLRAVASLASGQDWPEADETSLRRLSDAWESVAIDVERIGAGGDDAMQAALAGVAGAVNQAMTTHWATVGGSDGAIEQLVGLCRETRRCVRVHGGRRRGGQAHHHRRTRGARRADRGAHRIGRRHVRCQHRRDPGSPGRHAAHDPHHHHGTTAPGRAGGRGERRRGGGDRRRHPGVPLAQGQRDGLDSGRSARKPWRRRRGCGHRPPRPEGAGGMVLDGVETRRRRVATESPWTSPPEGVGAGAGDVVKGEE